MAPARHPSTYSLPARLECLCHRMPYSGNTLLRSAPRCARESVWSGQCCIPGHPSSGRPTCFGYVPPASFAVVQTDFYFGAHCVRPRIETFHAGRLGRAVRAAMAIPDAYFIGARHPRTLPGYCLGQGSQRRISIPIAEDHSVILPQGRFVLKPMWKSTTYFS